MRFANIRPLFLVLLFYAIIDTHACWAQGSTRIMPVPIVAHSAAITSTVSHPNGRSVLTTSEDQTAKLWDLNTGSLVRSFAGHSWTLNCADFSSDGLTVVTGGRDSTVHIWSTETGKSIRTLTHSDEVNAVSFIPGDTEVATAAEDGQVRIWSIATGKRLRTLPKHKNGLATLSAFPNGQLLLAGDRGGTINIWEHHSKTLVRSFRKHQHQVVSTSISRSGKLVASADFNGIVKIWNPNTGKEIRSFVGTSGEIAFTKYVSFSPDEKSLMIRGNVLVRGARNEDNWYKSVVRVYDIESNQFVATLGLDHDSGSVFLGDTGLIATVGLSSLSTWSMSGSKITSKRIHGHSVNAVAALSKSNLIFAGTDDGAIEKWDLVTGRLVSRIKGHDAPVSSVVLSNDLRFLVSGGDTHVNIWKSSDLALLKTFSDHKDTVKAVSISGDGGIVASGGGANFSSNQVITRDQQSYRSLKVYSGHAYTVNAVALSQDGRRLISGGNDFTVRFWDTRTGKPIRVYGKPYDAGEGEAAGIYAVAATNDGSSVWAGMADSKIRIWRSSANNAEILTGHHNEVTALAFSSDEQYVLSGSGDRTLRLWSSSTHQLLKAIGVDEPHLAPVTSVAFAPGRMLVSSSADGSIRVWDRETGKYVADLIGGEGRDWITITHSGFFASEGVNADSVSVVSGLQVTLIDQIHQSLFNPDLVREALAGDPNKEVEQASKVMNLEKVLASGPEPTVAIKPIAENSRTTRELITIETLISGREGKGVGRIEWRVNGITAGVLSNPEGPGPEYLVRRELALSPGTNKIEVLAYNASNLLAAVPATTTVVFDAPAETKKPRLHVLAIGIDNYSDERFRPLSFAVSDAAEFGGLMGQIGNDQSRYDAHPQIVVLPEQDATRVGIERAIAQMTQPEKMHPRDTFILFAAAHGTSKNGRFYLIPYDFHTGPDALETMAVSQTHLQEWLANRVKAQRVLVLLDTCASGALVGGAERSRIDVPASEAAVGRLHEATGRPVLTAAATGKAALEGVLGEDKKRHGVFTYAVLEAFRKGDLDSNGALDLNELVSYVQKRVPELSSAFGGSGEARGALTRPADAPGVTAPLFRQSARFGSRGDNFVLGRVVP